jgi:D-amino peptidase
MMRTFLHVPLLTGLLLGAATQAAGAQRPLKVYISADMEGVAGAVTGDQLGPTGFEYERFRGFMTAEVLAAIQGARDAGATTIVVSDSHGNGENLLIERLPDDVMIVRSWPRPLMMMQGIDSSFAAVLFIGYHASTTSAVGVRAHTMSSADYTALALNGVNLSEAGVNAAIAGHFGVPVVMISGDDAAVAETRGLIGNIEGAVVKRAISFHAAISMTPQAAQALIREAARRGVTRRAELRPYVLAKPVRLDLTFKNYLQAELASYLPDMERPTAHSVRYTGRDIVVVSRLIEFLGQYAPGLRP